MNDTDAILEALKDHRAETRQDMHELRGAVVKIADAAADMGKTMARSDERHAHNEETAKRINRAIDDHEARVRAIEHNQPTVESQRRQAKEIEGLNEQMLTRRSLVTGGWKVMTAMGALIIGIAALGSALVKITQ